MKQGNPDVGVILAFGGEPLVDDEAPLRGGPTPRVVPLTVGGVPLSGELTGLIGQQYNPAEQEALRLGLTPRELKGQGTGEPLADILLRRNLGPSSQMIMTTVVGSPGYQALKDTQKAVIFTYAMRSLREGARGLVVQRMVKNVEAGAPLSEEEIAFLQTRLRDAIAPRVRQMLRREGYGVPR